MCPKMKVDPPGELNFSKKPKPCTVSLFDLHCAGCNAPPPPGFC